MTQEAMNEVIQSLEVYLTVLRVASKDNVPTEFLDCLKDLNEEIEDKLDQIIDQA